MKSLKYIERSVSELPLVINLTQGLNFASDHCMDISVNGVEQVSLCNPLKLSPNSRVRLYVEVIDETT